MDTITWVRPSGTELTTNDREETIAYCVSLGWELKGEKEAAEEAPKKRGRPKKDAE